jgi:hypothetical protein
VEPSGLDLLTPCLQSDGLECPKESGYERERRFRSQAEAWHESGLVITTKLGWVGVPTTPVPATRKACQAHRSGLPQEDDHGPAEALMPEISTA